MHAAFQGIWTGLGLAATFALIGSGLSLFHRASGYLNMAHGAMVMVVGYMLARIYGTGGGTQSGPPAAALGLGAVVGLAVYLLFILPSARQGPRAVLAVTLGAGFIASGAVERIWGTSGSGFSPFVTTTFSVPGGVLTGQHVFGIAAALLVGVLMLVLFRFTMVGRALQAVAADAVGASCVGINPRMMQALAMVLSGALAGLAAAISVPQQGVDANAGNSFLLIAIVAAVLGGMDSIWGTALGALVLGLTQGVVAALAPSWADVAEFGLLMAILAVRPQGLLRAVRA
jgi:branched-subunit amino acid ABC-type transport system permease component